MVKEWRPNNLPGFVIEINGNGQPIRVIKRPDGDKTSLGQMITKNAVLNPPAEERIEPLTKQEIKQLRELLK